MAIKQDLSTLPKATSEAGVPPDKHLRFLTAVCDVLITDRAAEGELAHSVEGTRYRHSDAGKCARALSYTFAGIAPSDDPDASGLWNFKVGHWAHEFFQEALTESFGADNVRIESTCHLEGFDGSGHADAEITLPDGRRVCYELKTVGGFGFKMAVGERSAPQGPKWEHIVQGALNATACGADLMTIGYLSKEAISVQAAARKKISELGRFMAEWTFDRDFFAPIAAAERDRVTAILALVDDGKLAARKIPTPELPAGAEIIDPTKGLWELRKDDTVVDAGSWWACGYCNHRTFCAATEGGRIPIDDARAVAVTIGDAA